MIKNIGLVVMAYLIGSFPTAYLATRLTRKEDVRQIGSSSVGGMNVMRNVGFLPGALAGLIDVSKGALAVGLARYFSDSLVVALLAALLVVVGHNWMIFIGFSGGKGVGTTAGVLLVLCPLALPFLIATVLIVSLIVRDSYVGTASGFVCLPVIFWAMGGNWQWILFGVALAAVVIAKHLRDIKGFLRGRRELF